MGFVKVNGKEFETKSIVVSGNSILCSTDGFVFCEQGRRVQLRGSNVSINHLSVDNCAYIEGRINKGYVSNCIVCRGRLESHKALNREYIGVDYKPGVDRELREQKAALYKRQLNEGRRRVIRISGEFDSVIVRAPFTIGLETNLCGTINEARIENCLFFYGSADSLTAGNCLTWSRW